MVCQLSYIVGEMLKPSSLKMTKLELELLDRNAIDGGMTKQKFLWMVSGETIRFWKIIRFFAYEAN